MWKQLISCLVLVGGLFVFIGYADERAQDSKSSARENYIKFEQAKAFMLGKEISRQYPKGKVLVIVSYHYHKSNNLMSVVDSLEKGLGEREVIVRETNISPAKEGDIEMTPIEEIVKARDFDDLINTHKDVAVVVCTFGFPLDLKNMRTLRRAIKGTPKFAMLTGDTCRLKGFIKAGAIIAMTTYKPGIQFKDEVPPKDPAKAFDIRYLMITPENIDSLPEEYKRKLFR